MSAAAGQKPSVAAPSAAPSGAPSPGAGDARSPGAGDARPGLATAVRVEFSKLLAQLPLRIMLALCVVVPVVFAVAMRVSDIQPADTLFGRWAGTNGFATSLFVLDWMAAWGVAVASGFLAGDVFASEDRLGTWKTLLTQSVSRTHLFLGKAIAATAAVWLCWIVIAAASIGAGLAIVGAAPLVGLSGQLIPTGHALVLVVSAWGLGLLPVTALAALGVLFSIAARNSVAGVFGPLLTAIVLQGLEATASGKIVRTVMLFTPFDAYHALFTDPVSSEPIVQAVITSILYTMIFAGGAWWLLRRREFAGADSVPASLRRTSIKIGGAVVGIGAVLAALGSVGPTALTATRMNQSVASTFGNLNEVAYQWQSAGKIGTTTSWAAQCDRGGVAEASDTAPSAADTASSRGPGNDWSCIIRDRRASDHFAVTTVDVELEADGCYRVQAQPGVFGGLYLYDINGRRYINPLYAFDGCLGTP
jgi:ABC-2 type transport system permease protein